MNPLLIINLFDRLLDLAGRIGNTEELEEYIELRKDVRKARVALANSLGSATAQDDSGAEADFPEQENSEDETNSSQE